MRVSTPHGQDERLHSYLENLDARLHDLMESSFVGDPDEVAAKLQLDAAFVTDSIDAILSEFTSAERQTTDLNTVVDEAAQEFLLAGNHPIAIRTRKDPLLVGLPHTAELLFAIVLRTLQVAFTSCENTTQLEILTATDGYRDTFEVRALAESPAGTNRSAVERLESLADLLDGMGGSIVVTQRDDCLTLSLSMETRTSSV